MRRNRIVLTAASLLLVASDASAQRVDAARPRDYTRVYGRAPEVSVWIDRYVFRSGERIRAYFESEPGAYVTILRVSTLGNVSVLYPRRPTAQRVYRERLPNDEVPFYGRPEFYLNEPEGVGLVFAIASFEPFDYSAYSVGGQWSTRRLAAFQYGDPYRTVNSFVAQTLSERAEYSSDYIQYEVFSGSRYRRYGYAYGSHTSFYGDRYLYCLDYFGLYAVAYCRSYAGSGAAAFPYIIFGTPQRPAPASPTPVRRPKMQPPGRLIPDPAVVDEATKASNPSASKYSERSSAPRVIDNTERPRIQSRQRPEPLITDDGENLRVQSRQRPEPSRYDPQHRVLSQPRAEPAAVPRFEPPPAQRYDPPTVQRHEPPAVQRYEPPRVEAPRIETRQASPPPPPPPPPPAPVVRERPAPVTPPPPPPTD